MNSLTPEICTGAQDWRRGIMPEPAQTVSLLRSAEAHRTGFAESCLSLLRTGFAESCLSLRHEAHVFFFFSFSKLNKDETAKIGNNRIDRVGLDYLVRNFELTTSFIYDRWV